MLQIVMERFMNSTSLRCSGRLVAGEALLCLREAVMCQADKRRVQLDLSGVETIDAAGLGLLVSLHVLGCVVGFELQLRNPVRRVRALLKLTRLESVLEIQPPVEQLRADVSSTDSYSGGTFKRPMLVRAKFLRTPRALALHPLHSSGSEILQRAVEIGLRCLTHW